MAIEDIEASLQSCSWEIRSALSLITSEMRNNWQTLCTSPTCNIQYVRYAVSIVMGIVKDAAQHADPVPQAVKDGVCGYVNIFLNVFHAVCKIHFT